jgi:serine/threonine protein phosphatase 1
MGDVHGAYRALRQCLERSAFDFNHDSLIHLGDVCDGWPETRQCIDELMKIKNLTYLLGNHDFHTLQWAEYGDEDPVWLDQGGIATQQSYNYKMPTNHVGFIKGARPYFVLENKLFVHAGILPGRTPEQCGLNILLWDRTLVHRALELYQNGGHHTITSFDEVYVGHTPIGPHPLKGGEVWMMDTGAGWNGVLSMMDLDTKEVFASDAVPGLYPGVEGRARK